MANMNPDQFNNIPAREAATGCMAMLDAVQAMPPGKQLASIACLFRIVCEKADLPVADMLTTAGNITHHAEGVRPEFTATEEFIKNEWNR